MIKKIKKFVKDNDEVVFLVTSGVIITAATIATLAWTGKLYNAQLTEYQAGREKLDAFTLKSNAEGKAVYLLADGSYIAVRPQDVS